MYLVTYKKSKYTSYNLSENMKQNAHETPDK